METIAPPDASQMDTVSELLQPFFLGFHEAPVGFSSLKPREQKFLAHYLQTGNAKEAAIAAGVPVTSAKQMGSKWLTRHDLRAVLNQLSHKVGCSPEHRIARQEQIAAAMHGMAMDEGLKPAERAAAGRAAATADTLLSGLKGQLTLAIKGSVDHHHAGVVGMNVTMEMVNELHKSRERYEAAKKREVIPVQAQNTHGN